MAVTGSERTCLCEQNGQCLSVGGRGGISLSEKEHPMPVSFLLEKRTWRAGRRAGRQEGRKWYIWSQWREGRQGETNNLSILIPK